MKVVAETQLGLLVEITREEIGKILGHRFGLPSAEYRRLGIGYEISVDQIAEWNGRAQDAAGDLRSALPMLRRAMAFAEAHPPKVVKKPEGGGS